MPRSRRQEVILEKSFMKICGRYAANLWENTHVEVRFQ